MKPNKIMGILMLLIFVCVTTAILNQNFIAPYNLQNLLRSSSLFAIIGIGAVMVIVTGGIDLSTGSLIGLVGCTLTMTLKSWIEFPPAENGSFLFKSVGAELMIIAAGWVAWESVRRFRSNRIGPALGDSPRIKIGLFAMGLLLYATGIWLATQTGLGNWVTISVAIALSLLLAVHLGLLHGLLITKLHLQPSHVICIGVPASRIQVFPIQTTAPVKMAIVAVTPHIL